MHVQNTCCTAPHYESQLQLQMQQKMLMDTSKQHWNSSSRSSSRHSLAMLVLLACNAAVDTTPITTKDNKQPLLQLIFIFLLGQAVLSITTLIL
jgi:hypothetical protein